MKMHDEYFSAEMFATVTATIAEHPADFDKFGVHLRLDDGSQHLLYAGGESLGECLVQLAERWEKIAQVMRERANPTSTSSDEP